jgi:hypothetical protein
VCGRGLGAGQEAAAVPFAALTAFAALCVAGEVGYKNDTGAPHPPPNTHAHTHTHPILLHFPPFPTHGP